MQRPVLLELLARLDPTHPVGIRTPKAKREGGKIMGVPCYEYFCEIKAKHPKHMVLTRVRHLMNDFKDDKLTCLSLFMVHVLKIIRQGTNLITLFQVNQYFASKATNTAILPLWSGPLKTPSLPPFEQIGDFFEAIGFDALLLCQFAYVNPMAPRNGVSRAGVPLNNMPRAVRALNAANLSVVSMNLINIIYNLQWKQWFLQCSPTPV